MMSTSMWEETSRVREETHDFGQSVDQLLLSNATTQIKSVFANRKIRF